MKRLDMKIPSAHFEHNSMEIRSASRGDIKILIDEFGLPLKYLHIWPVELASGYVDLYGSFVLYGDLNREEQQALGRLHRIDGSARYFRIFIQPRDEESIEPALKCKVSGILNGVEYKFMAAASDPQEGI
jgi:hypothetical protein